MNTLTVTSYTEPPKSRLIIKSLKKNLSQQTAINSAIQMLYIQYKYFHDAEVHRKESMAERVQNPLSTTPFYRHRNRR